MPASRWITALAAASLLGSPLLAQAPGLPVMNGGVPRGLNLGGMVGFGDAAAGSGTAVGLTGALGFRRLGIGGYVATLGGSSIATSAVYSVGGNVTAKVLGGPLVPLAVNLQFAAGFHSFGENEQKTDVWRIPVGLGFSWTIPQPLVAIKPWISPRLEHRRVSGPIALGDPMGGFGRISDRSTDFGVSGGITLGFLNGMGVDLAVDHLFADGAGQPTTFGIGLSLNRR